MEQPTKSFNTQGGKNRLRFASAKSRAKRASADVYRSSDNKLSTSATAVREKRVHDSSFDDSGGKSKKKRRNKKKGKKDAGGEDVEEEEEEEVRYFGRDDNSDGLGIGRTAVIVSSKSKLHLETPQFAEDVGMEEAEEQLDDEALDEKEEEEQTDLISGGTIFLTELEISAQRNGSQLFQKLVRELRPLCKSLAELLHHGERIVDLLYAYLLSPRGSDGSATPCRRQNEGWKSYKKHLAEKAPNGYVVHVGTNDILHLFGVLGRELRQEIYPFLTTRILPRIIDDMLSPPTITISATDSDKQHNNVPLDVSLIESAFRTISYLFKYNADQLIHNEPPKKQSEAETSSKQLVGDADILRQYYGKTICHKRDIVRRLACESYAPLLRKCLDKGLKRHLTRTVKALAGSLAAAAVESESDEDGGMTFSAKKARADAIDGVSSLLFQVSRGAPGRLHSKKGRFVTKSLMDCLVNCVSSSKNNAKKGDKQLALERNKAHAIYEVASQFVYKLRGHIVLRRSQEDEDTAGSAFADVMDEMHRALDVTASTMKEKSSSSAESPTVVTFVMGHVIDLMTETIDFQEGRLIKARQDKRAEVDRIATSLQALLNQDIYSNAGRALQDQILQYLCAAWKTNPSHPSFALRLGKFFPSIVAKSDAKSLDNAGSLDPALFLGQNLLPYLPKKVASTYLIPALLGAAAAASEQSDDSSLVLLHTISTAVWSSIKLDQLNDVDIDDAATDALFTYEAAEHCPALAYKVRCSLFDICLSNDLESLSSKQKRKSKASQSSLVEQLARIGYVSRSIPFLVCLECSGNDDEGSDEDEDSGVENSQSEEVLNRVFKWYSSMLKKLDVEVKNENKGDRSEAFVVQSLVLESFSKSAMECHKRVSSPKITSMMKKALTKAKASANSILSQHPTSLWTVRGVAAVTKALSNIDPGSKLNEKSNETFEMLVPNLAEANHFLRLYTLQILESYPARPFVTDHADLDLTDDLEEEPSYRPQPDDEGGEMNADGSPASSLTGLCDVISLLRILESIPIALPNERKLTSQLSRIEVYARTGKLPIVYAEAITCHMLGLLHVKFAPVWPAAVTVVVSLSLAQEGPAWPYIEAALKQSMKKTSANATDTGSVNDGNESSYTRALTLHHSLCVAWETSKGKKVDIFGPQNQDRNAQVSRHVVADELTLFESIWSIMENGPHLTSTKSKVVVPIFFEFLVSQYYVFHQDEPDSREIDVSDLVEW